MKPVITELDLLQLGRAVMHALLANKVISKVDLIDALSEIGIDADTAFRLVTLIGEMPDPESTTAPRIPHG